MGDATNNIFWLDPWSKDGQQIAAEVRPYTHDLRMHAEAALTLIAQARAAAGPNPAGTEVTKADVGSTSTLYDAAKYGAATSALREPDAVDAMELGARRMDFIGLKFQVADEMAEGYARAFAASTSPDRKIRATVTRELTDINSVGYTGRLEDIRNGYTLIRDLFESAYLRSNRPYSLRNVLEQYDYTTQIWLARIDKVHSAQRQWSESKTLAHSRGTRDSARPASHPNFVDAARAARDCPMTNRLTARRLITADGIVDYPGIAIDADGNIAAIEPAKRARDETTLAPAFFDIHVHGAAGHDAMEGTSQAFSRIGAYLATRGVGHFLATTVTAPVNPNTARVGRHRERNRCSRTRRHWPARRARWESISKGPSSPTPSAAFIRPRISSRRPSRCSSGCGRLRAATSG